MVDDDDFEIYFSDDLFETVDSIMGCEEIPKRVKFNLNPSVQFMYTWTFAYKQARKGDWEMLARDRCRFQRRIAEIQAKIDYVLESNHRDTVYQLRFQEDKTCSQRGRIA